MFQGGFLSTVFSVNIVTKDEIFKKTSTLSVYVKVGRGKYCQTQ